MAATPKGTGGGYAHLPRVTDGPTRDALKAALDRIGALEKTVGTPTSPAALTQNLDAGGASITGLPEPIAVTDAVPLGYLRSYVDAAISLAVAPTVAAAKPTGTPALPTPTPAPGPIGSPTAVCVITLPAPLPAPPNVRYFRGDFCGIRVPGLPFVPQGPTPTDIVYSPFYDRYAANYRAEILAATRARGYTHFNLSWGDSQSFGQTPAQFAATVMEVNAAGLYPAVTLLSKIMGPDPDPATFLAPVLAALLPNPLPIVCVGGELNLIYSTAALMQAAIDYVAGAVAGHGTDVYVHFSAEMTGSAGFWRANVGKLVGLWHQTAYTYANGVDDCVSYQAELYHLLQAFKTGSDPVLGGGWPTDSGFGGPFLVVAEEYAATPVFFAPNISEAQASVLGLQGICTPYAPHPVSGFFNGCFQGGATPAPTPGPPITGGPCDGDPLWPGAIPPGSSGHATLGNDWACQTPARAFDGTLFTCPPWSASQFFDTQDKGMAPQAGIDWMHANGYDTAHELAWYPSINVIAMKYVYLSLNGSGAWDLVQRTGA